MSYTDLSPYERYQIQHLHRGGFSSRGIGEQIERSPSTIRRELQRNAQDAHYEARHAQRQSMQRRHAASSQPRLDEAIWPIVRAGLAEDLSPEQIAGSKKASISHERIYQYIAADRTEGESLWTQLRRRKQRRQHQGNTIVGKGTARVVTLVERKTGLVRLRRVASGGAEPTMQAILHALYPIGRRVHTLTWDNGSEFAEHALIDIALDATRYFAEP